MTSGSSPSVRRRHARRAGRPACTSLAWEVPSVTDLAAASETLRQAGALTGASDHGVSKSLYGRDPDGNEFEIMWAVPREDWGEAEKRGVVAPLDLDREIARYG